MVYFMCIVWILFFIYIRFSRSMYCILTSVLYSMFFDIIYVLYSIFYCLLRVVFCFLLWVLDVVLVVW